MLLFSCGIDSGFIYKGNPICNTLLNYYRFHHLKLYPEDESGLQTTKKPVVVESYNEIVFPGPFEFFFFARVQNHPAVVVPRLPAGFTLPNPGKCLLLCLSNLLLLFLS